MNSFIGALVGKKAKNGIFITTSYFTKDAKSYIESLSDHHIELIDGDNLVQKIIEHKLVKLYLFVSLVRLTVYTRKVMRLFCTKTKQHHDLMTHGDKASLWHHK